MKHYDFVSLIIGHANSLTDASVARAAIYVKRMHNNQTPTTAFDISLSGFADDPRSLCDIPEARHYILRFMKAIEILGVPMERFFGTSRAVFDSCVAVEQGKRVEFTDVDRDVGIELGEHRKKAERHLH